MGVMERGEKGLFETSMKWDGGCVFVLHYSSWGFLASSNPLPSLYLLYPSSSPLSFSHTRLKSSPFASGRWFTFCSLLYIPDALIDAQGAPSFPLVETVVEHQH
jgi:hypothetical protein